MKTVVWSTKKDRSSALGSLIISLMEAQANSECDTSSEGSLHAVRVHLCCVHGVREDVGNCGEEVAAREHLFNHTKT